MTEVDVATVEEIEHWLGGREDGDAAQSLRLEMDRTRESGVLKIHEFMLLVSWSDGHASTGPRPPGGRSSSMPRCGTRPPGWTRRRRPAW